MKKLAAYLMGLSFVFTSCGEKQNINKYDPDVTNDQSKHYSQKEEKNKEIVKVPVKISIFGEENYQFGYSPFLKIKLNSSVQENYEGKFLITFLKDGNSYYEEETSFFKEGYTLYSPKKTFHPGEYQIKVVYTGDSQHESSQVIVNGFTIDKAIITLSSATQRFFKKDENVEILVNLDLYILGELYNLLPELPTGKLNFKLTGKDNSTITLFCETDIFQTEKDRSFPVFNSSCSFGTLDPGRYDIVIEYPGDNFYSSRRYSTRHSPFYITIMDQE